MKDQVVRAGKYASLSIILLTSLPLLIPLLLLLSFLGFTFVLPLGCTIGGFLYLHKFAAVLYRKLPLIGGSRGASRGRNMPAPRPVGTFSALPLNEQRTSEFEVIDPEFDAVLVSTAPTEVLDSDSTSSEAASVSKPDSNIGRDVDTEQDMEGSTAAQQSHGSIAAEGEEQSHGNIAAEGEEQSHGSIAAEGEEQSHGSIAAEGEKERQENKFSREDSQQISNNAGNTALVKQGVGEEELPMQEEQGKRIDKVAPIEEHREDAGVHSARYIDPRVDVPEVNGATRLLPHQANEEDIWICKDCGWKYPNARPSAKIRRSHKKHCEGHSSTLPAPELSVSPERASEVAPAPVSGEKAISAETDVEVPQDGKKIEDETRADAEREQSRVLVVPALDDQILQESPEAVETVATTPEQESSSLGDLRSEPQGEPKLKTQLTPSSQMEGNGHHLYPESSGVEEIDRQDSTPVKSVAFVAPLASNTYNGMDDDYAPPSPTSATASESFRSVAEDFTDETSFESSRWSVFSEASTFDEEDRPTEVQEELQLREDLDAMKGIVGDRYASRGPLLTDIQELGEFLGIDLPPMGADEWAWAKVAVDLMKVVVGVE